MEPDAVNDATVSDCELEFERDIDTVTVTVEDGVGVDDGVGVEDGVRVEEGVRVGDVSVGVDV